MKASGVVLGFHGMWRDVAERLLLGRDKLKPGRNAWDWLGTGVYLWEGNLERALEWKPYYSQSGRSEVDWCALGVVVNLGNCLDLLDHGCVQLVREAYQRMEAAYSDAGLEMPQNLPGNADDRLRRKRLLDFQVLNYLHEGQATENLEYFDTVRGAFYEGEPVFPGAEIYDQTHIQICVRNLASILGYFAPPGLVF